MPQSPARKALTRVEIFVHAARLFRLRGYAGTNIDDIMLAAGLTRGAFYAHFKSKDDLFAEVVRAGDGRLSDWLLRCARQAVRALLRPSRSPPPPRRRASPKPKRSRSRRKAAGARPPRRAARSRGGRA